MKEKVEILKEKMLKKFNLVIKTYNIFGKTNEISKILLIKCIKFVKIRRLCR